MSTTNGINSVTLMGHLTRDPELRYLPDGRAVCDMRLAVNGASNGGMLIGAVETQRPDLFGVCLPQVGVMDMLRFNQFGRGSGWESDYGSPDDPEAFRWLRGYSPLHNVTAGTAYPATLILTGDHDDRVAPGHSFKFAATLQAAQAGAAPVLIRVETSAGHGAGKPTKKAIDEATDLLTFVESALAGELSAPDDPGRS